MRKGTADWNEKTDEIIVWKEDLTHDGIEETIKVNITLAKNPLVTGDEETIRVYSGATGNKIWTGHADTIHPGWNGFYIYKSPQTGKAYLVNWRPKMYQGVGNYYYKVLSLSETGDVIVLAEERFDFRINQDESKEANSAEDKPKLQQYIARLNYYLKNGYLLLDTDNGEVRYSKTGEPMTVTYESVI